MPYTLIPPGKRGPCWYVRGSDAAGPFEYSTGKDVRRDAARWVEEIFLPARARARVPGRGEAVTFATAARHYKAANPHLVRSDVAKVDAVAREIGDDDCRAVNQARLVDAANKLLPGRANATKNRWVIGPAAAVLHYAAEQEWCADRRFRKFKVSAKSNREPATPATLQKLFEHLEDPPDECAPQWKVQGDGSDPNLPYKRLLLAILYETGLRIGHTLSIEWRAIDLQAGRIGVVIPKSDELALVPISAVIVAELANLPDDRKTGHLFPWRTTSGVYPWLRRACARAKVHYTPHQSRHALATAAQDIPDKKAAELGVWLDPRSLHRYQHVKPEPIAGRDAGFLVRARRAS